MIFYHLGMVLIVIGQGKIGFETLFQRSWDDLSTRPDIHSWSIDFLGMAPSMDWFSWENLQENSVAEDRGFYLEIFPGEKHRRAEHDSKSGPQKSGRPRCSVQPRAGWNSWPFQDGEIWGLKVESWTCYYQLWKLAILDGKPATSGSLKLYIILYHQHNNHIISIINSINSIYWIRYIDLWAPNVWDHPCCSISPAGARLPQNSLRSHVAASSHLAWLAGSFHHGDEPQTSWCDFCWGILSNL